MLGVMSLFQDPDLEIGDKTMKIGGKVDYMFADPAMIVSPPEKELVFPDPEVSFTLSKGDFSQVIKAAAVLGLPFLFSLTMPIESLQPNGWILLLMNLLQNLVKQV